jgi:hypothetical protein
LRTRSCALYRAESACRGGEAHKTPINLRLADMYEQSTAGTGTDKCDESRDPQWTVRENADCVSKAWYAEQVGKLA